MFIGREVEMLVEREFGRVRPRHLLYLGEFFFYLEKRIRGRLTDREDLKSAYKLG